MEITWKKITDVGEKEIESWQSALDKHYLCMTQKNWATTSRDIASCLELMKNGQFRNAIGFVNGKPAVAVMFGIEESGNVLNIYNIIVNPKIRERGVGSQAIKDVLYSNSFNLNRTYSLVKATVFKSNYSAKKLFLSNGLKQVETSGQFIVFGVLTKNLAKRNNTNLREI